MNTMIGKTNSKDDWDFAVRKICFRLLIHKDYLDVEARKGISALEALF